MAKVTLKSEAQILGQMAETVLSKTGLNDLNPGSVLLTLLQAAASQDFAQYYQMLQIIRNYNLDSTTGTDLDNRAFEYGLTRIQSQAASGKVSILREESFVKISSTFYTGFRSRIAGDTEIFVNNAADFPSAGTLIIGRGTPNEEQINYSTIPVDYVNYYKITLDTPLGNDHSLEESIVLLQGSDTIIPAGTSVVVPATSKTQEIGFNTTVDVTILAGEDRVDNVPITCQLQGSIGNIGVLAISGATAFPTPPFDGARAENGSSFSNGQDRETDTKLRFRIKAHIQSISQSTKAGIKNSIDGLVDPVTAKRVVSSNIITPDNVGLPVKIYIDDGTGFEPDFLERGQEVILDSALGTETRLQLDLFPVVKAQVETLVTEPYDLSAPTTVLNINVGNESEAITFYAEQFTIPTAVTCEEVVKAINAQAQLIEARTSQVGTKIVINGKADINETIQVIGGSANSALNFPLNKVQTFYLYKNDLPLSKDGETAFVDSQNSSGTFDFSSTETLVVVVDGKTVNPQTITFNPSDFETPEAASLSAVIAVINEQLAGATATSTDGHIRLTSNTELSSKSKIHVTSGSAVAILNFPTIEVVGKDQDYSLNPELGIIELAKPLAKYDRITTGTRSTRAFTVSSNFNEFSFGAGAVLNVAFDGGIVQSIPLVGTYSVESLVTYLNAVLIGGAAAVRVIGPEKYLELRTNSYADTGSMDILPGSANALIGLTVGYYPNITPHVAFQSSNGVAPYNFVEGSTLVVVLDNDPTGKTFIITFSYGGEIASATSASIFSAKSAFGSVFSKDDTLVDFYIVMKSGACTSSADIGTIEAMGGSTFKYIFKTLPDNFKDFQVNDQVTFSEIPIASNNGSFLVSGVPTIAGTHLSVLSKSTSNPASLTPVVGSIYIVGADAGSSIAGSVKDTVLYTPTGLTPVSGDSYIVAPDAQSTLLEAVRGIYNSPPVGSTVHGYRYIVGSGGSGDWLNHNHQIAEYSGIGTPGWIFTTPNDKDAVFNSGDSKTYQFETSDWVENKWGGKAGQIATFTTIWGFAPQADKVVYTSIADSKRYQYSLSSNTWTENIWGGDAGKLASYVGPAWTITGPATNDVAYVLDVTAAFKYSGSAWLPFNFYVEVDNLAGIAIPSVSAGSGLLSQRRKITDYVAASRQMTLATPFRVSPALNDAFVVMPSTNPNVVDYMNNLKITSLSSKAYIDLVFDAASVQISSKANGSDGYVQVTGGKANEFLQFSNTVDKGLRAYAYYTGLIKLVHSTIYGDESDLITYPGVGAAGVKFQILPPTVQEVDFDLALGLEDGVSLSSVENDVKTQIINYVNSLGIYSTVILSQIIERVLSVQGVNDCTISFPTDNIIVGQNELARTKASIIAVSVKG